MVTGACLQDLALGIQDLCLQRADLCGVVVDGVHLLTWRRGSTEGCVSTLAGVAPFLL